MENLRAMDLSVKPVLTTQLTSPSQVPLIKPIPRLPWTITWYQSVWSQGLPNKGGNAGYHNTQDPLHFDPCHHLRRGLSQQQKPSSSVKASSFSPLKNLTEPPNFNNEEEGETSLENKLTTHSTVLATVLDVACCDGPVVFERISNPNFALTVEHSETPVDEDDNVSKPERRQISLKTYLCIYCNQSFKSLFCYQKHKKRHLNPVSVDITATQDSMHRTHSDNKKKTKDLNVQFFPCKKCGCKFPSYYFVHKHRKVCHSVEHL